MKAKSRVRRQRAPAGLERLYERCDDAAIEIVLALRDFVRAVVPGVHESVFEASYAYTLQYRTTPAFRDTFCYIAAYPRCVNLGFNHGAELQDPGGLLRGTGRVMRHVRISSEDQLGDARVRALVVAGAALSRARMAASR